MTARPYPIGAVVRGANCIGQPFEATVVGYAGPYTPILSDGYVTPASLIREVVMAGEGPAIVAQEHGSAGGAGAPDALADFEFEDDQPTLL